MVGALMPWTLSLVFSCVCLMNKDQGCFSMIHSQKKSSTMIRMSLPKSVISAAIYNEFKMHSAQLQLYQNGANARQGNHPVVS